MTTPDIFADGFDSANAFLNTPSGQGDGPRLVKTSVTVADSASVATLYGLIPFNKGAEISYGASTIKATAMDTASTQTLDIGYVYDSPDTTNSISDPNGFIAASTVTRLGGVDTFDAVAGYSFKAGSDGWITATLGTSAITVAGTIKTDVIISYQS